MSYGSIQSNHSTISGYKAQRRRDINFHALMISLNYQKNVFNCVVSHLHWALTVVMSVRSYKILRLKCCREGRGGGGGAEFTEEVSHYIWSHNDKWMRK